MNSFLCFSVVLLAAFFNLQVEADLIEQGCSFIRQNPDLIDDMVKCETDNYPARFNEIATVCLRRATGLEKAAHIRATCANRSHLNNAMPAIQTCVMEHQEEIMNMLQGITRGVQRSQSCIRDLVTRRLNSNGSRHKRAIGAQASAVATGVSEI